MNKEKLITVGIIAVILIFVVSGAVLLFGNNNVLATLGIVATVTSTAMPTASTTLTPSPTLTFTPTITPTRTPRPTATATPIPAWVTDFAKPILAAIQNRRPALENDYSTDKKLFTCDLDSSCEVVDGVLKMRNDSRWMTTVAAVPNEFVWSLEFTPKIVNETLGMGIGWPPDYFLVLHPARGVLIFGNNQSGLYKEIGVSKSDIGINITSRLLVIVKSDRVAVFVNDQPVYYEQGLVNEGRGFIQINTYRSSGSTEIYVDNVKFWRLNNIPNLP